MEDILLTQKEIEKYNELFEYEMTEIILNLKGKFLNYNGRAVVLKDIKLTEDSFSKDIQFVPLMAEKVDNAIKYVSLANKKTHFIPLKDIKTDIRIENDVQSGLLAEKAVDFVPITNITIKHATQSIPQTFTKVDYTPLDYVVPEIKRIDMPTIGKASDFTPVSDIIIDQKTPDIININRKLRYQFLHNIIIKQNIKYIPDIIINKKYNFLIPNILNDVEFITQKINKNTVYKLLQISAEGKTIKEMPVLNKTLRFISLSITDQVRGVEFDMPYINKELSFELYKNPSKLKINVKTPMVSKAPKFVPAVQINLKKLEVKIPDINKTLTFQALKKQEKIKLDVKNIVLNKLRGYRSFYQDNVQNIVQCIPKMEVNINYLSLNMKKCESKK